MGGDFGFWNLQYSMRRAAYGYLCFRFAARLGVRRAAFYCQPEVLNAVLEHVRGDDYLKNWRPESDRLQ
jgi:hypothetical protein